MKNKSHLSFLTGLALALHGNKNPVFQQGIRTTTEVRKDVPLAEGQQYAGKKKRKSKRRRKNKKQ